MGSIKQFMGMAPKKEGDKLYSPSNLALKMAVKDKTDYDHSVYENGRKGQEVKILIIGTEEDQLVMQNGSSFLTGNHPVELFVPMLHWIKAGFKFDFATPTGKEMKLEHWAMPNQDKAVMEIYEDCKDQIKNPLSLKNLVSQLTDTIDYAAVFIPGGHGAVIDLPKSKEVQEVLFWAKEKDKFIISICHGPAAFLAAGINEQKENFIFNGYYMAAFPDSMDKLLPKMGYLPGKMPWYFGKELQELGMSIVNKIANGQVYQDRKLITGDSPLAANKLGKLSTLRLLEEF